MKNATVISTPSDAGAIFREALKAGTGFTSMAELMG